MRIMSQFLKSMKEKDISINYLQIYKDGEILEEFSRLNEKTRLSTYSVSKSITSLGVGIALDEGIIKLKDHIYKFFDEIDFDLVDSKVKKIKIVDLLTMTSGLEHPLFFMDDKERYENTNWIEHFFYNKFKYPAGTKFLYSNFNSYILGCIIQKASGETLLEYMNERFFKKLEIGNPDWLTCPLGHSTAANSLMLTIDEMTKIGVLLLNKGLYKDERIISEGYINLATKNQIKNNPPRDGYGYQFWINKDKKSFRAEGKYGQFIIVVPYANLVVSVQALTSENIYDYLWDELILKLI